MTFAPYAWTFGEQLTAAKLNTLETRVSDALGETYKHAGAASPVNTQKLYVSDTGWSPLTTPIPTTTTPERAQINVGGIYNESGGGGINYIWGSAFWGANAGDAPFTAALFKAYGQVAAGSNHFAEALGDGAVAYGAQFGAGEGSSKFVTSMSSGVSTVTVTSVSKPGSRIATLDLVAGTGIPAGSKVGTVSGPANAPTSFTLVAADGVTPVNASSSGSNRTVTVQAATPGNQTTYGVFITGTGGNDGGAGNPNGRAIHVQSYTGSEWKYGFYMGASSMRSDGHAIYFVSQTANRVMTVSSGTYSNGFWFNDNNLGSGSMFKFSTGNTMAYAIEADPAFAPTSAFMYLPGQTIDSDSTTGLKILSVSTRKLGFYGKTPIVRPSVSAAATDAATTQTLANSLRSALINIGMVA